jgi:hypothetical protein
MGKLLVPIGVIALAIGLVACSSSSGTTATASGAPMSAAPSTPPPSSASPSPGPTPASPSAGATPEFYVHNGYELGSIYQYPDFPATIGLDNHDSISGLDWAQPAPAGITATGTLNFDTCTPDCAAGTYVTYPVELMVSAPQNCMVKVYQTYGDQFSAKAAYVYNTIYVKALSGNPPSYLVGNSQTLPPACGGSPSGTGSSPTDNGSSPSAHASTAKTG